ncbi:MAG: response regulator transcription factor [Verrucomicrobia bacterium]|nr:response regulator transcription factor [Verrucomicrobiota bacterium]
MNSTLTANLQTSPATRPIRVALVEDDATQRESLLTLLREAGDFEIGGVFSTAAQAQKALPQSPPDVALVDICFRRENQNGIELVRELKASLPATHFMMLTVLEDAESLFAAFRAGATGYLVKKDAQKRLAEAVKEIHAGGSPMSSQIAKYDVEAFKRTPPSIREDHDLSPRQSEVLIDLAEGLLYKEIAAHLGISLSAVKTHIRRIYEKLHAHNRTEAVRNTGRG